MAHINIEIKARCQEAGRIRSKLQTLGADFIGTDRQTDTYFKVTRGRLKLREGIIENNLIFYRRQDTSGPKQSDVHLLATDNQPGLKELLEAALGILVTVQKKREIYFIDNVKFHLDTVDGLGSFVEIEAIDETGSIGNDKLLRQCREYMELLDIKKSDLIEDAYSDMLLEQGNP